jgi:hypothetical protein
LTVNEELLTPQGMHDARTALIAKYQWLIHVKPLAQLEKIKLAGLEPRCQGNSANSIFVRAIGQSVANINHVICFRPLGENVLNTTPKRDEEMFAVAIPSSALPKIVTVDWTFGSTLELASIIKANAPWCPNEAIFCEVVRRRGSVIIYEAIPASQLRLLTIGQSCQDPSSWPQILDAATDQVMVFRETF